MLPPTPPTPKQWAAETYIRQYRQIHGGISPTQEEIAEALGISKSAAQA